MNFSIRRLSSFEALFARLARKATKLGLPAPSFRVTGERKETAVLYAICDGEREEIGTEEVVVSDIEITGLEPVALKGWNFAAVVETVLGNENVIRTVPGVEVPSKYRLTGCTCDHCGMHRNRKLTYIVRKGGEFKQVGSTCLQDFLGDASAEKIANQFEFFGEILCQLEGLEKGEREGWEGGRAAYNLKDVIVRSLAIQAKFGWRSGRKAYEEGGASTAALCRNREIEVTATEEQEELASVIMEYFASLEGDALEQDLVANANLLCRAGWCSEKSYGLTVALPACYQFAMNRKAKAEKTSVSEFQFTPGERVKGLVLTIKKVMTFDSQYGTSVLTILEDAVGNVFTGKAIGEEGQTVRLTATVKEHKEFNNTKQTCLLRAKVEEVLS